MKILIIESLSYEGVGNVYAIDTSLISDVEARREFEMIEHLSWLNNAAKPGFQDHVDLARLPKGSEIGAEKIFFSCV